MKDHHSEYLAKTIAALTPEGHVRVDELLDRLARSVGDRGLVSQFALIREREADSAKLAAGADPGLSFTKQQLDDLITGFTIIRDQAPRRRERLGERRHPAARGRRRVAVATCRGSDSLGRCR